MGRVCVEEVNMSLQRLLNTRMLELRRQLLASGSNTTTTTTTSSRDPPPVHLSRNLFGPSDRDHNLQFAQQEMEKVQQADCRRWNFDFRADKPREGEYSWQEVREAVPHTPALTCRSSSALTCLTTPAPAAHPNTQVTPVTNKGVKRLHNKSPHKVAKRLCTDYFTEVKSARQADRSKLKLNSDILGSAYVNTKLSELLKIKPANMK